MAYPGRPAQRPPPVRNYGAGPPPRGGGYQSPQDAVPYDQGYNDYAYDNNNPYLQNGEGGYDDVGYGYPGDQAVPRSYGPPRGAPRAPRGGGYGPMDGPDRGYAYGGRPPPSRPPPNGYDGRRGYGDRRGPPPRQDRMRPGPGPQRVPPSPDDMPWDNPFPMFPQKDPRARSNSKSIEKGMARMDMNGPMPPPPGKVPVRPHTSNGRRPDAPRQPVPPSPGRSRANYPGPAPMRSASAGRHAAGPPDRFERSYTDADEPPPMPQINRSATMPVASAPTPPPMVKKPLYPGQSTYQEPGQGGDHRLTYYKFTEDLLNSYYNTPYAGDPEMPNFDAMPNGGGTPIDESLPGLEQPAKPPKTPVESTHSQSSRGGQYTAFSPPSEPLHAQSPQDARGRTGPNQFENAGFQFDLPGGGDAGGYPQDNMGYGYHGDPYHDPMQAQYQQGGLASPISTYSDTHAGYAPREGSIRSNHAPPRPYRANNQPAYVSEPPPPQQMVNEMEPGVDPDQHPDALPHHPVPFRPGHDAGAKPAPVRQYIGTNTPSPAPAVSQAPQPLSQTSRAAPAVELPVTREELQRLQQAMRSNPSDQKTQFLFAKKSIEAATVLVDESRMDPKTKAKAREKYVLDGHKIIKKLVSSGYPDAQFYLADCYGQGKMGLQVDNKEAFNLYHSAAKLGHAQSAYRVAVCCEIGQEEGGGTKRDPFKAVHWYKRAASLGDPPAMYKVGMIMFKGLLGQAKTPREGISWLKRAAERADEENPHALHELALMYMNATDNDVVIRDEAYASQLFHEAAELGYKFSQFRLGTAYEYGLMGCPVDSRQSIIYYTCAAAQGEHQSELALSGWYLTGSEGILQQSDTEAYLWARKAAAASLPKAEYAMGYFTEVGIGTTANLDDAKRWYWRAAAQGFPKARERLEELKKGGARMQKTRLSRSAVNQQKQNEGDCVVM